jgi:hypothetical protein
MQKQMTLLRKNARSMVRFLLVQPKRFKDDPHKSTFSKQAEPPLKPQSTSLFTQMGSGQVLQVMSPLKTTGVHSL